MVFSNLIERKGKEKQAGLLWPDHNSDIRNRCGVNGSTAHS